MCGYINWLPGKRTFYKEIISFFVTITFFFATASCFAFGIVMATKLLLPSNEILSILSLMGGFFIGLPLLLSISAVAGAVVALIIMGVFYIPLVLRNVLFKKKNNADIEDPPSQSYPMNYMSQNARASSQSSEINSIKTLY